MGFNSVSGASASSIAGSSDVALNNVANDNYFAYDGSIQKWKNITGSSGAIPSTSITDSTAVGRSVLTSATQAAARTAIGVSSTNTIDALNASVIIPENYGVIGDGTTDNTAAWVDVVAAAHTANLPIWVTGRYRGQLNASNKNLNIFGPGTFVQASGEASLIRASHTPGTRVTVSSIDQDFIVGPLAASPSASYAATAITVPASSLNQFKADDIWVIASEDGYDWNVNSPINGTLKAGQVPVAGVVFTATYASGAIKENDTITGVSSGTTALVGSVSRVSSTVGQIIVKSIASGKTFTNGEGIRVSGVTQGTINSAGAVLLHGELEDTYTTNPVLRKFRNDLKLSIDGLSFDVIGDPDGLVGTANRNTLIEIKGVVKPIVNNIKVYNSWATGLKITSCYRPVVNDMWMGRGANNATTGPSSSNEPSEQGYGYGIEINGTTYGGSFQISGSMMRHAFTTNPASHSAAFVGSNDEAWMNIGTVRHNTVRDSSAIDNWSAGFDNHEGAQDTTYINCINKRTMGAHRRFSGMTGFNNRSHNTTYINCRDEGSAQGFNDSTRHHTITYRSTTRYENCVAENYQMFGFTMSQPDMDAFHRAEYINCRARGDGRAVDAPYAQAGFDLTASNTILRNCISERFNTTGIDIHDASAGATPTIIIDGIFLDFRDTTGSATTAISVKATVNLYVVQQIKILQKTAPTSLPAASITVTAGSPNIRTAGATINVANTTTIPVISGATSGAVTGT